MSDLILSDDRWCAAFDHMNRFIESLPNAIRRELDGDRGIAVWSRANDGILLEGLDVARSLDMIVTENDTNRWKAHLAIGGKRREDGSPRRIEYHAELHDGTTVRTARIVMTYIRFW